MASSSGSFSTNAYNSRRNVVFNWWINSQNIVGNYTDIGWNLVGGGSGSGYYVSGNFKVIIDGEQVYFSSTRINLYNGTTVASGTKRIYHDSVGKKSFSAYAEAGIYTIAVNCTGSGSWELPTIPRYLNSINVYNNGSALNSIYVKWTCDPARDWTQYSLNGGSWTDAQDSVASDNKSGTFSIRNLAPGTTYNVKIRLRRADSSLWSESGVIYITTKSKATINSPGANFSLNSNNALTVSCTNPSGNQIAYFLDCPSGTRRLTSGKTTATSYTWTAAQILSMLQYFPNANASSMKVGVITYGNNEYYDEKEGTLNVVNSNPTFSNFTYTDTDSTVIALTGNNQTIVKGYSNVKATILSANKAIAKNYATMEKYRFIIGSVQKEVQYSNTNAVEVTIDDAKNNVFTMYAIDSRGNSNYKQISPATYIDYSAIEVKTLEATRKNGIGSEVTLKFTGNVWEGNFGNISNEIRTCYYRYKKTRDTSWINGSTTITPTRDSGEFSFEGIIRGDLGANGFSSNESFDIQVLVADRLSNNNNKPSAFVLGTGTPAIAITKDGCAIMNMYDTSLGGALQITGDVYINGKKIN